MARFLADVGRSGVVDIGKDLMDRALQIRERETTGQLDILKTGMGIEEFRQNKALRELNINKAREEEADRNRLFSTDFFTAKMPMAGANTKSFIDKTATDMGVAITGPDGKIGIRKRHIKDILEMMNTNSEIAQSGFQAYYDDIKTEVLGLQQKISEHKDKKPGEPVPEALQSAYNGALIEQENIFRIITDEFGEQAEGVKVPTAEHIFTPTPEQAQKFGIKPGKQYVGLFDDQGRPATILREASAVDLEVESDPLKWNDKAQKVVASEFGKVTLEGGIEIFPEQVTAYNRAIGMLASLKSIFPSHTEASSVASRIARIEKTRGNFPDMIATLKEQGSSEKDIMEDIRQLLNLRDDVDIRKLIEAVY